MDRREFLTAAGAATVAAAVHPSPAFAAARGDYGNLPFAVDFRDLYATALEKWWGGSSVHALGARFRPVDFLRA